MSRQLGFALPQIARRLDDYRAGTLGIDDMVWALQERVAALDQQISQLQAQKQVVLEHQAWLKKQQPRQRKPPGTWPRVRPRTSAKSPSPTPLPRSLPRRMAAFCGGHAQGPHARAALCPCRAWPGRDGNPGE